MTTTGNTSAPNPQVQQLATDAKAALTDAVTALKTGIDNAIAGTQTDLPKLENDALSAAEAVIEKDAPASIQPFVTAVIGLGNTAVQPELEKLNTQEHVYVQLFQSKLDSMLTTLKAY